MLGLFYRSKFCRNFSLGRKGQVNSIFFSFFQDAGIFYEENPSIYISGVVRTQDRIASNSPISSFHQFLICIDVVLFDGGKFSFYCKRCLLLLGSGYLALQTTIIDRWLWHSPQIILFALVCILFHLFPKEELLLSLILKWPHNVIITIFSLFEMNSWRRGGIPFVLLFSLLIKCTKYYFTWMSRSASSLDSFSSMSIRWRSSRFSVRIRLSSISSSFSLDFMVVYSFSSRFIFFWLILSTKAMLNTASWSASNFFGISVWKYFKTSCEPFCTNLE